MSEQFKTLPEYADTWSLNMIESEGVPISIRYREGVRNAVGHPEYPLQIAVAVRLLDPSEVGLTNAAEAERLYEIEDALTASLAKDDEVVFVMSRTSAGIREFIYYAQPNDLAYYEAQIDTVRTQFTEHDIQCMMRSDPAWTLFAQFSR
jgi:hypothetical protein